MKIVRLLTLLTMLLIGLPAAIQAQFNYTINNDGSLNITGYTGIGYNQVVTIPSTILVNGVSLPVTSIGNNCFYNATYLNSITIGTNVTNIGDYAFYQCFYLTNVTMPNSVISLASVTIGTNVTSIGNYAFSDTILKNLAIPNSVTNIGNWAFFDCVSLTNAIIGNGVTSIPDHMFYVCSSLTRIIIGNSVTSIVGFAFSGCHNLAGVYFESNAPISIDSSIFIGDTIWYDAYGHYYNNPIVYYLPGTTGWGSTFVGIPTQELTALLVSTASLANGTNGLAYSQTLTASGGVAPYSWINSAGTLPPGLVLASDGLISGTPTASGPFNFTVQVTDALSTMATQALSVNVFSPPQIATVSLPNGTATVAYSQTLTATGGETPYSWTNVSGTLPPGLSLATNGLISGMPTTIGTFNFTAKVTDALSVTATQALTLTILPPLVVTTVSLPNATTAVAYSQTLTVTGGQPPYSWTIISGTLPPG